MVFINELEQERKQYEYQKKKYYESFRDFKGFKDSKIQRSKFYTEHLKGKIDIDLTNDIYYLSLLGLMNDYIKNGNFSLAESIYILVNIIDPELKMLDTYVNCCKRKEIETEIRKEFGFFDKNLIVLENVYAKRYKKETSYELEKNLKLTI